jgi:TetR/AcrR family transcriptional regulator, cholesterol catabolism regulator
VRRLNSAARILSRNGYAGTRLTDIADDAGLQAPAIYYYFQSREELIEEVMWVGNLGTREYVMSVLDGLDPALTPMERIIEVVAAHLRHVLAISDFAKAATRNGGQLPDHMQARQLAEQSKYGRLWRDLLNEARDAGQLRDGLDLNAARMFVLGALNWAPEWWDPARGNLDSAVRTAQDLVRYGLGKPAPATPASPRRKQTADTADNHRRR